MSFADGWAALHLDAPSMVPRVEFSAEGHWELVRRVTGIQVNAQSPEALQKQAGIAFQHAWNYSYIFDAPVYYIDLDAKRTRMGHAVFADQGVDYDNRIECPFTDVEEVFNLDMDATYGIPDHAALVRRFNDKWNTIRAERDLVPTTGIYITCISGLIDVFGWDMLLTAAGTDPKRFGEFTNRYCAWIQRFFNALADSDAPTLMIHDDIVWTSGPFIHPDWYRTYVFPNYKNMFRPLVDAGKIITYCSDGTYTMFVDDIAAAGVNGFIFEPTTDLKYIADRYGRTHHIIGNADTRVLLWGSREEIEAEVRRCMDIGKQYPGYFMCVSNHIPSNTPVESALWYDECYRKLGRR